MGVHDLSRTLSLFQIRNFFRLKKKKKTSRHEKGFQNLINYSLGNQIHRRRSGARVYDKSVDFISDMMDKPVDFEIRRKVSKRISS